VVGCGVVWWAGCGGGWVVGGGVGVCGWAHVGSGTENGEGERERVGALGAAERSALPRRG